MSIKESIVCAFFRPPRHQLVSEPWLTLVWWLTGEMVTTTTMTAVITSTTQSSLGLSSLIFIINSFMIQPNRPWTRFKNCLPPCLTETLIVMTKSDMITERMALPITVQIGIGSKTTMKRIMRMKSMQKESLGIVVVLQGIMVEINRSRRTIGWK